MIFVRWWHMKASRRRGDKIMDKEKEKKDNTIVVVGYGCQFLDDPIPGSLIRNCVNCGTEVWISPSWRGKKIDKIVCMTCYEKNVDKNSHKGEKGEIVVCITEEQLKEFNFYCRKRNGYEMTIDEILRTLEIKMVRKVVLKKKEKN